MNYFSLNFSQILGFDNGPKLLAFPYKEVRFIRLKSPMSISLLIAWDFHLHFYYISCYIKRIALIIEYAKETLTKLIENFV